MDELNKSEEGKKYCYKYPHPSVTTDCVIFGFDGAKLRVLLVQRGVEPYKGRWALPGGFLKMDECVLDLPSNLDYKEREIVVTTNVNYEGMAATYNGTVESFMITPDLPEGMGIASDSGAIYGTSATALDRTEFVVTASNAAGSTNVTIFLTVEVPHCEAMADFPRTPANESYSYDCTKITGYKGVSERTCVLNADKASATWAIPTSYCIEDKVDLYFLIGIILIVNGVVLLILGILFMVKREKGTA